MNKRQNMAWSLRVLARLLAYPDAALRAQLGALRDALHDERALTAGRLVELDALIDRLRSPRTFDTEAVYVETFDWGRGTALHLFEHVHGDSRDRGPAMVDLVKTYEAAGLLLGPLELPDHLCVVLEYASTQPPEQARAFLREVSHILQVIFSALNKRRSPYAIVIAAVLDLAGEKAQTVQLPEEPALDDTWAEPVAFDGCSTQGQARPGQAQPQEQAQPIQIVKNPARSAGPSRKAA